MSTSTVFKGEPTVDMPRSIDRLVTPGRGGVWEVRSPEADATVLYANNKHTAIEWAWNITRDTGGRVVITSGAGVRKHDKRLE